MPLIDYLHFCAQLQGVSRGQISARIREMVQVCGLTKEKHKKIEELSKGYRQRVGIAQAMIHDPEILILDEPTSGLDPNQIVEIRNLIKDLGRKKTVLLSSHILSEVEVTCDRILIINKGRVVADGTPSEIQNSQQGSERLYVDIEGPAESVEAKLLSLAEIASVKPAEEKGIYHRKQAQHVCQKERFFCLHQVQVVFIRDAAFGKKFRRLI